MSKSINQSLKRIFVVGCPRSGTTLLQSILLTNPSIISFPESHFFINLFKQRTNFQKRFNLASQYSRPAFTNFMHEAGYQTIQFALPRYALSVQQQTHAFTRTLDRIARKQKKAIWLEKTPDHVNFIDFIETHVKDALFIHIVRNGPDVVASLYDVTHKYPLDWEGPWAIERCLRKWITCVQNTYEHLHKPNHLIIKYGTLVNDIDLASQKLSKFIDTDFHANFLTDRQTTFKDIALKSEPWKVNSSKPIYKKSNDKFFTLFDDDQQRYILEVISKAKLTTIKD